MMRTHAILGLTTGLALVGAANAAVINVSGDISRSQTWTADNTYNLVDQVYILPGASQTIVAGPRVASPPTANGAGSLAITRGAKIFVNGTADNPVIMTSTADVATWTGGDPATGTWREACNEWGNLTIMGRAYISENAVAGNTPAPNPNNIAPMEGLVADFVGDPNTIYGGGDDNDDSGSISYLSIRYGGRVIGLANELNGLSLGGIGRDTDIHHVEIMNNVDDGIEIWGGTVNLKYVSIWNIGDDSFDVDQGWRGKAQFGLIVQGYSVNAPQGSGIGDNVFEVDGAEQSDYQPVTTTAIYNFTVVGQPISGDHGMAFRDNARVQYRNCIFMDLGERVVSFDNIDGDGGAGYGLSGTLPYLTTWTTPYTATSTVNPPANPAEFYTAQSAGDSSIGQGFLNEVTDSVFFRNLHASAYSVANGADAVGVTVAGGSNPAKGNVVAAFGGAGNPNANMPVVSVVRAAPVALQGGTLTMIRVTSIDPRAANAAVTSISSAPSDGFFTPAPYRGGFDSDENWLCGWTAADAYGFSVDPPGGCPEPEPCAAADFDCSGAVNGIDLGVLLLNFSVPPGSPGCGGAKNCPSDIDGDGDVDGVDLGILLNSWTL